MAHTPPINVEVYSRGQQQPTKTIHVTPEGSGSAGYVGLAVDAKNNLWVAYYLSFTTKRIYLVEYTPGSSQGTTYTLPSTYDGFLGALRFDKAGHAIIGTCLAFPHIPLKCGTALIEIPSLKRVAFFRDPAKGEHCLHIGLFGANIRACFPPYASALDANETQFWTTTGLIEGFTYPQGVRKTAYVNINHGPKLSAGAWGLAIGP